MSTSSGAERKSAPPTSARQHKPASGNLIQLEESAPERSRPKELNQKIDQIDTELDSLRSELSSTNKRLKTSLSHLADTDVDLTSRVSDAYQQLGDLDNAYKSLTDKSSHISSEIKSISKSINEINRKTDADIGALGDGYRLLAERTEELARKSKLTTQNLNKSIRENAQAMQTLEKSLLAEIDGLAEASKARDDSLGEETRALGENLNKATEEIRNSRARMLKLQAVDQALEKRADALEATTQELTKKSRELSRSTTTLNQRTGQLAEAIEALQAQAQAHSGLIAGLQSRTEKTANALYALIMLEKRHFRLVLGGLALLLLALAAYLAVDRANWETEAQVNASLHAGISDISDNLAVTDNEVAGVESQVKAVDRRVTQVEDKVHQEISSINDKLTTIGDQVESLDGRVTNMRPYKTFGNGNVIHGPAWVASQPAKSYVVHLATVGDKQALYDLAERYSHYLKDDLAYLPVTFRGAQQYALLYGHYASDSEAYSALSRMPRTIERQQPAVYPMSTIQNYNNKNE